MQRHGDDDYMNRNTVDIDIFRQKNRTWLLSFYPEGMQDGVQMHLSNRMTNAFDMGFHMKRYRMASEWSGDYS
jgi:hypothetical protein